jgi:hypothetical protein
MNQIVTFQDIKDISSLLLNSKISLERIPDSVLNYAKIFILNKTNLSNLIRPYRVSLPDEYRPVVLTNSEEFDLIQGTNEILLQPDNLVTSNFAANLGHEKMFYSVGAIKQGDIVKQLMLPQIDCENAELYRNIITTVSIPGDCSISTSLVKTDYKPVISVSNNMADLRNSDFSDRVKLTDTNYTMYSGPVNIRFLSDSNSVDAIGLVNEQANFFKKEDVSDFITAFEDNIGASDKKFYEEYDDLPHTINQQYRIINFCLDENFKSMVNTNSMHIIVDSNKPQKIKITQFYEIYKYLGNKEMSYEAAKMTDWNKTIDVLIRVLQILYFKKLEDIIKIFYYERGIDMLPLANKDKNFLVNVKKSKEFKKIWSILVLAWQSEQLA